MLVNEERMRVQCKVSSLERKKPDFQLWFFYLLVVSLWTALLAFVSSLYKSGHIYVYHIYQYVSKSIYLLIYLFTYLLFIESTEGLREQTTETTRILSQFANKNMLRCSICMKYTLTKMLVIDTQADSIFLLLSW